MSVDHETLLGMLTRLKLTAIRDQLDTLLDEAAGRDLTLREALAFLCAREVARKDERGIEMATKIAHFPTLRDLDGFDFGVRSSLTRRRSASSRLPLGRARRSVAAARPARRQQDAPRHRARPRGDPPGLLGAVHRHPGAGRSIGQGARQGLAGRAARFYAKPKLLIVNELGYLAFEPSAAHLFLQLVSRRYERGSLLITSNSSVGDWGTVLGGPMEATAILDRLLHHRQVITIRGNSYRLRESAAPG